MSTPTDPYSSSARRPFDEDDILAPISPSASSAASSSIDPLHGDHPVGHEGMDPAFDTEKPAEDSASEAEAPAQPEASPYTKTLAGSSLAKSDPVPNQAESHSPAAPEEPRVGPTRTSAFPHAQAALFTPAPKLDSDPEPLDATSALEAEPSESSDTEATTPWDTPAEVPATSSLEEPGKRGWTHATTLIFTILLIPVVWYLLSDASVRLFGVENSPWETGIVNFAAIGELAGGLAVMGIVFFMARKSSLGVTVTGILVSLFGILPVVTPADTLKNLVTPLTDAIGDFNPFTGNVVHHLNADLGSGRILIFGVILIFTGMVSHLARRQGEKFGVATARREAALSES